MDVTGIDASPQMLARARVLLGPDVALEEVVLPDLPLDRTFDAAVSTLDGLNYLTPADFARTMEALAQRIRPGGWLVFDLHADAAMRLLEDNPVIEGEDDGRRFVLRSTVDRTSRTCSTTIELTAPDPADSFTEEHVQHVHADSDVRTALAAAGFELASVTDEYTHEPVTGGTLRATWVSRRSGG
jgi:SAM-dependent methyltransferase